MQSVKRILIIAALFLVLSELAFSQCVSPCVNESTGINTNVTTNPTFTVTAGSSGNILVLYVITGSTNPSITLNSITLTNAAGSTLLSTTMSGSTFDGFHVWIGSISGGSSGTSLTLNFSATTSDTIIDMTEWPGASYTATVDSYGYGTAAASASIGSNGTQQCTTTVVNDLLVAAAGVNTGTSSFSVQPGGSYSNLTLTQSGGSGLTLQPNYSSTNSIGSQTPTWTLSSGTPRNIGFVVALRPVSAPSSSGTTPASIL